VDALGGLDTAIEIAREKAHIPKDSKVVLRRFPRRKGLLEALSEGEFPMVHLLLEQKGLARRVEEAASEWETLRPWAIAPDIRIR
jgi:hypothetical protein